MTASGLIPPEFRGRGLTSSELARAQEAADRAPDLIPIHGHRGIPNDPRVPDNPVFSVVGTDAIVYGVDLEDYLRNEFHGPPRAADAKREIAFWTALTRA